MKQSLSAIFISIITFFQSLLGIQPDVKELDLQPTPTIQVVVEPSNFPSPTYCLNPTPTVSAKTTKKKVSDYADEELRQMYLEMVKMQCQADSGGLNSLLGADKAFADRYAVTKTQMYDWKISRGSDPDLDQREMEITLQYCPQ